MGMFKDSSEVDKVIGGFLRMLGQTEDLAGKMLATRLKFKINYTEPDVIVFVDCSGSAAEVRINDAATVPDIELWMKSDVGHQFWLGKVNLAVALATKKIKAKGSIPKLLKLLPIIQPAFKMYPSYLRDQGLTSYL